MDCLWTPKINVRRLLVTNSNKNNGTSRSQFLGVSKRILFGLFFFGICTIFCCMDLGYQTVRNGAFTDTTLAFFGIFLLNIVLWIGINFQLHQKTNNTIRRGMFEELMDESSDILVCVLITPLYWCSVKLR